MSSASTAKDRDKHQDKAEVVPNPDDKTSLLHEQKTTDQAKDKEETPPSVDKSQRQPIRGFIIGIVIPAFVVYLAYVLFPIVHHKNILGGRKDFSDCTVL